MKNIIIITGASSGIGLEFALKIDTAFTNIDEIWLIARRETRLKEIAKVMKHRVRTIAMDVTDEYAMDDLENLLDASGVIVRMLINAAGFGLMGSFEKITLQEQLDMLMVNCEALTKMTYIVLPYMAKGSRIIQMSSSAAFLPQPNFAVYAATKSYVLSLSRALNKELDNEGIYVTAVCPGPVSTEFFEIAQKYENISYIKRLSMITPEKCVDAALRGSYHKKSMVVPGFCMKALLAASKCIPHECILGIMNLIK